MARIRRDLSDLLAGRRSEWFVWLPPDWYADALCAQVDPAPFYPEDGGSIRPAKQVCAMCPVRDQCRAYALENDEQWGVWGGMSESDRRKLRRAEKRALREAS